MKWMAIAVGLLLGAAACGGPHMGDDYGLRTRAALDAQIGKGGSAGAVVVGDDAKVILMKHRGQSQQQQTSSRGMGGAGASSGISPAMPSISSSSINAPPPRLDAMR
jgi:hypothetical protein